MDCTTKIQVMSIVGALIGGAIVMVAFYLAGKVGNR